MLGEVYICTDNQHLCEVKNDIRVHWETRFIGRKIIPEKYEELFDHNGYYIENEQYQRFGIVVNMSLEIVDGYITGIDSYKVKDNTCGHGRPQSETRELSQRDIKHFTRVLESVTIDHVGVLYDTLINSFTRGEVLPGGYTFVKSSPKGITLCTSAGDEVLLSKSNILQGLMISHFFIDVLYSNETLISAPDYFLADDIPLYLAVFSKVDTTKYRNYSELTEAANGRKLLREAETGYPALLEAITSQNTEKISALIKFAPLVVVDRNGTIEPPIILATRSNNLEIVRMLLAGGAFSKEAYLDEQRISVSPLHIAVQQKNYEMITLLCKYHGAEPDYHSGTHYNFWVNVPNKKFNLADVFNTIGQNHDFKALKIILPYAAKSSYKVTFSPKVFANVAAADIDFMVSIENAAISWPAEIIGNIYPTDREKCIAMVKQGCELGVVDYFIDNNDYDLYKIAISHHPGIRPRDSFGVIYERGGLWYQTLQEASSPDFNYMVLRQDRDAYLAKLIRDEKFDRFKDAVQAIGIPFPVDALCAFINFPKDQAVSLEMQAFFEYVLYNSGYSEQTDVGRTITDGAFSFFTGALLCNAHIETVHKYLEKYPIRITHEEDVFMERFMDLVEFRSDDAFSMLLELKLEYDATRVPDETWLRYNDFDNYKQKTIYELFEKIIYRYSSNEADLTRDYSWINKEKAQRLTRRWLEVLQQFTKIVAVAELDQIVKKCRYKRHKEANTALAFAIAQGINSEDALQCMR